MNRVPQWTGLAILTLTLGCGDSGAPSRAAVKGTVTLNGEPIAEGSITFLPTGTANGPTTGGSIVNGRYSIARANGVVVGENRVEIIGNRKTGKMTRDPSNPSREIDQAEQFVPEKFNRQTEIVKTVGASANTIDFNLKSE
jgi:hypothetical protein